MKPFWTVLSFCLIASAIPDTCEAYSLSGAEAEITRDLTQKAQSQASISPHQGALDLAASGEKIPLDPSLTNVVVTNNHNPFTQTLFHLEGAFRKDTGVFNVAFTVNGVRRSCNALLRPGRPIDYFQCSEESLDPSLAPKQNVIASRDFARKMGRSPALERPIEAESGEGRMPDSALLAQ